MERNGEREATIAVVLETVPVGPMLARFNIDVNQLIDIESTDLVECKRRLLNDVGRTNIEDVESLDHLGLLPALRVYHFNERELYMNKADLFYDISRSLSSRLNDLGQISTRNEIRCLIFLWKRLQAQKDSVNPVLLKKLHSQLLQKMNRLTSYDPQY